MFYICTYDNLTALLRHDFHCVSINRLIQAFSRAQRSGMIVQHWCLRRIAKIRHQAAVGPRQITCLRDRWAARLGGRASLLDYPT